MECSKNPIFLDIKKCELKTHPKNSKQLKQKHRIYHSKNERGSIPKLKKNDLLIYIIQVFNRKYVVAYGLCHVEIFDWIFRDTLECLTCQREKFLLILFWKFLEKNMFIVERIRPYYNAKMVLYFPRRLKSSSRNLLDCFNFGFEPNFW